MATKKISKDKEMAKSTTANAKKEKHFVPKIESEKPKSKKSVIDIFAKKVPPSKKTSIKKEDRPSIEISEELQKEFIELSSLKEISNIVSETEKTKSKTVSDDLYEVYLDVLWETKTQPQNPSIKAYDDGKLEATGLFVVNTGSRIKINSPVVSDEETYQEAFVNALVELGVSKENSESLVETEISFVPDWKLNLTQLLRGVSQSGKITPSNAIQQEVGEVLFMVIQGEDCEGNILGSKERLSMLKSITDEGWSALKENMDSQTIYVPTLVDGNGFLDRVCDYAESREELGNIMTVFKPVVSLRSVSFAVSDSTDQKTLRLFEKCKTLIEGRN